MADINSIIKGLEWIAVRFKDYQRGALEDDEMQTITDAIALLKEQEPRLVTEDDFKNADPYGYLPVWVEDKDDSEIICDCITKTAITNPDADYNYRYWISSPSDEVRRATPWGQQDQREYEATIEMAEYCERYEPTYNAEDGSM